MGKVVTRLAKGERRRQDGPLIAKGAVRICAATFGAAVALALAGLAGCGKEPGPRIGRPELGARAALTPPTVASITYSLTSAGYVSLNVYCPLAVDGGVDSNNVVRELKHTDWQGAGTHIVTWDGLDNNGVAVPTGGCSWKLIEMPAKLSAQYLLSVGSNYTPGTSYTSYAPGMTPISVAIDGNNMYVASRDGEISNLLIKQTVDGSTRLWDSVHPTFQGTALVDYYLSLAVANGALFALGSGDNNGYVPFQTIYKFDPATGLVQDRFSVAFGNNKSEASVISARAAANDSSGLIYVAVTYPHKDLVNVYSYSSTNGATPLSSIPVTAPQGVAVDVDGTVYVSKGQHFQNMPLGDIDDTRPVAEIDRVPLHGTAVPFITTGITTPTVLDIDTNTRSLIVYDGRSYSQYNLAYCPSSLYQPWRLDQSFSDPVQQVKIFDLTGHNSPSALGALGGRLQGPYNRSNFTHVSDIKADGNGGFYVVEYHAAPHRVAHFDRFGRVLDPEFYGGTMIDPPVMVDPTDPTVMYVVDDFSGNGFDLMRILVNYTTKTWTVDQTYAYDRIGGGLVHFGYNNTGVDLVKHNGVTYIAQEQKGGFPQMVRVDTAAGRLVPVTVTGGLSPGVTPQFVLDAAIAANPNPGLPYKTFQWNDFNGDGSPFGPDGKADPHEFLFSTADISVPLPSQGTHVDANGDFYEMSQGDAAHDGQLYRFGVSWSSGSPRYPGFPIADALFTTPGRKRGQWYAGDSFPFHDPLTHEFFVGFNQGGYFQDNGPTQPPGPTDTFLSKWTSTDDTHYTYNWTVGKKDHSVPPTAEGGKIENGFRRFIGTTHGCYALTDVGGVDGYHPDYPAPLYVWDHDGLWVGNLFDTISTAPIARNPYLLGNEPYYGTFFTSADQQTVYFIGPSDNESRIYQITGFDGPSTPWTRLSGFVAPSSAAPTMEVSYNGNTITSGGAPLAANGTDFGETSEATNVDHTFTIRNTGTADLELPIAMIVDPDSPYSDLIPGSLVTNTGTEGGDFIVTEPPASKIIPGGSTRMTVRFVPSGQLGRSTVLGIANNGTVNPFNVKLAGQGTLNTKVNVQSFVTSVASYYVTTKLGAMGGMQFRVQGQPLTVTSLGRWVLPSMVSSPFITPPPPPDPADFEPHNMFLVNNVTPQGGGTMLAPSRATVQTSGAAANAFQFASLASPVVLATGTDYGVVSTEDRIDISLYGVILTSTSVAAIAGPFATQQGVNGPWTLYSQPTNSWGPVNFKYVIGTIMAEPSFAPAPGTYTGPLAVTISDASPGATIKYTTDGSTPSQANGTTYTAPVNIASTATLKAIAVQSGFLDSYVATGLYTKNTPPMVTMTDPPAGTCYLIYFALGANATDPDTGDAIDRVEFSNGVTKLATATSFPYAGAGGGPAGHYTITARAYDKRGGWSDSAGVPVYGFSTQDVGSVGLAGSVANYGTGVFNVNGAGAGIAGSTDAFRFVYVPLSGNATITADVTSFPGVSVSARAGVMMRQAVGASDVHASTLFNPLLGTQTIFARRTSSGGSTSTNTVAGMRFVRLQRVGNTLRSFGSSDGTNWTPIGSAATVTMSDPINVGLAVTSGTTTLRTGAAISGVVITQP